MYLAQQPSWDEDISSFTETIEDLNDELVGGLDDDQPMARKPQNKKPSKAAAKATAPNKKSSKAVKKATTTCKPVVTAIPIPKRVKQAPRKAEFPRWGVDSDDKEIEEGPTKSFKAPKAGRKAKGHLLNNKNWPEDTHLYYVVGKTIPLTQQDPRIRTVIRLAITSLLGDLLFEHSFPDHDERIRISRKAVITASKSYEHKTMIERLQNDLPYLELVAKAAQSRISQYRAVVKAVAAIHVLTHFGLKAGCGDLAAELLDGHSYIFPVKNGQIDYTKPYGHPIFVAILRDTIFKDFKSIGFRIGDRFYSSIDELQDELETPPPMMGFFSTSVHVSIEEWLTGIFLKRKFTAELVGNIYEDDISDLGEFAKRKLRAYHQTMASTYSEATNHKMRKKRRAATAVARINFDGISDGNENMVVE